MSVCASAQTELLEIYDSILTRGIDPAAAATLAVGLLHNQAGSPDDNGATLEVLTPPQVAKEIGRSPATVRAWCAAGLLGRDVRQLNSERPLYSITREELREFLKSGKAENKPRAKRNRRGKDPDVIEFF